MLKMRRLFVLCLFALMTTACIPGTEEQRTVAHAKATKELQCPLSELESKHLGNRLFRVEGCKKEAVYRVICKFGVASCYLLGGVDWVKEFRDRR